MKIGGALMKSMKKGHEDNNREGGSVQVLDAQTRKQLFCQHQQNHLRLPYFSWDVRGGIIEYMRVTVHPELLGDVLADFLRTQALMEPTRLENLSMVSQVEEESDMESSENSEVDEDDEEEGSELGDYITQFWSRERISTAIPITRKLEDPEPSNEWHLNWCQFRNDYNDDLDSDDGDSFVNLNYAPGESSNETHSSRNDNDDDQMMAMIHKVLNDCRLFSGEYECHGHFPRHRPYSYHSNNANVIMNTEQVETDSPPSTSNNQSVFDEWRNMFQGWQGEHGNVAFWTGQSFYRDMYN